jgi:Domain of unknown function (DUF4340)
MIKKTTLFVLLSAIVLGAAVYYFDWTRGKKEKPDDDATRLAFSLGSAGITSVTLSRPTQAGEAPIRFEKREGAWEIVQPVETGADRASLEAIVDGIAAARITETEPGTPDRLKVYGLDPPLMSVEFQTQGGAKHSLLLGKKDFVGVSVYAIVDGAKDVSLVPESLFVSMNKSFADLRDRAVVHMVSGGLASFDLKNAAGDLAATKEKTGWKFTKPNDSAADTSGVESLLTAISVAKASDVVSEKPENLGKYSLDHPSITFTSMDDKGKSATLIAGRKGGDEYFARDTSRPMIFRITPDFYKRLSESYDDLRDRNLVHLNEDDVNRIELQNASGTIVCNRKSADQWILEAPEDVKGKAAGAWKVLTPITSARADEVLDHAPSDVAAQLSKPAIEVTLTDKEGKKVTVGFSKPSGDFIFARTSNGPAIYKLKNDIFNELNFKASDLVF